MMSHQGSAICEFFSPVSQQQTSTRHSNYENKTYANEPAFNSGDCYHANLGGLGNECLDLASYTNTAVTEEEKAAIPSVTSLGPSFSFMTCHLLFRRGSPRTAFS